MPLIPAKFSWRRKMRMARRLGISKEVQDKVNHNHVVAKEERNRNVAAQVGAVWHKDPYKTEETKEQDPKAKRLRLRNSPKSRKFRLPSRRKNRRKRNSAFKPGTRQICQSQLGIWSSWGRKTVWNPEMKCITVWLTDGIGIGSLGGIFTIAEIPTWYAGPEQALFLIRPTGCLVQFGQVYIQWWGLLFI